MVHVSPYFVVKAMNEQGRSSGIHSDCFRTSSFPSQPQEQTQQQKNVEAAPAHDTTVMSSPLSPGDIFPTMFFPWQ
jgi:hypothetical protein